MKNFELLNDWVNLHKYMGELKTRLADVLDHVEQFPQLKPLLGDCIELASILGLTLDDGMRVTSVIQNESVCIADLTQMSEKLNTVMACIKRAYVYYQRLLLNTPETLQAWQQLTIDGIDIDVCERLFKHMNIGVPVE